MANRVYTAADVEGDNAPETPNIFYTGQMIHRAIGLCGGLTTDGKGAIMCKHSPDCGLPKIHSAIRRHFGSERDALLAVATPELIAATIGTTNDFPPIPTLPENVDIPKEVEN
jgi:hypothetical protein